MTLLSRIFVLLAVALLPAIAIQAYSELDLWRMRRIKAESDVLNVAKLAAAEHQQIVQGIHQVLVTLSELPAIKAKDRVACNDYLEAVKRQFPAFLVIGVAGADGDSFCRSAMRDRPVNVAARPYFSEAMKTGRFTIGEYSLSLAIQEPVIQFVLRFNDNDNHPTGIIICALRLDYLAGHMAERGAPPGAALAITDRNGTYLARYPGNAAALGRKMPSVPAKDLDEGVTADLIDIDGVERIVGFSGLGEDSGGLVVSYGVDKAQAFAAIQDRTVIGVLLLVLSTTFVLGLTTFGARRFIHRPLGQLVDAANAWRRGDYARRVNIAGVAEIDRVAGAFNVMAQALQQREHELHKAKERAEEDAAKITTIFESTTDCVLVVDKAWRLTYVNRRAKDQLVGGRDIVGRHVRDAFSGEHFEEFRKAMFSGEAISFEKHCPHSGRWLLLNVYPSEEGLAVYFRDITEHKRALEAKRITEEQLHQVQKMEATGQLTGGIAHDFNNLLTVVQLKLETITERTRDEGIKQLAAAAQFAAGRGAKLTAQLLAFSRRQRLEPRLVSVNDSIGEFMGLIRQAVGAECEVKLLLDGDLWRCHIDPAQLQTALLNLAINARDAIGESGGLVTIQTLNVVLDGGAVPGSLSGPYVLVSVSDTGPGMTPEVLDRAFEPFFTTKEIGKGSGLGLSMVYGFVRQSGGDVTIESVPGAGTTVILYLPRASPASLFQPAPAAKSAKTTGTERILLVEDDEAIMAVTADVLSNLGYHVTCARNGPEALQILQSSKGFDLLLSDIGMPQGMNGVELAREAKRIDTAMKVLLTSGYAGDILERNLGACDFPIIAKPFLGADLAQRIRMALQEV